jgi:4-amino-4-deoxy-L-arabinose transferase-like glycosyltransferase
MTRARYAIPGLICLLAFALRVIALDTRPVWYDDAFAIFLAEQNFPAIFSGTAADTMPPLYYALLHLWIPRVGATPFALRMLSVALSLLSVALMYAIGARAFGSRAGLFAMLFTALAAFQMYHAQELRMYAPLALGALVFVYGVLRAFVIASRKSCAMTAIVLGTAIALYAHNLAFVTLLAADVYFVLRRDGRALARLIALQAIGAVLFLPWLAYVPGQVAKIQRAFWTQPPGIADILQMLVVFTTYLPLPALVLGVALFVSIFVAALAALYLARNRRVWSPALGLLGAVALAPPAILFALSYLIRPVFVPRGAIASSLAYYAILGMIAARASRRARIAIVTGAGILALMILPFYYSAWGEWRRAPFADADQFLRAQMQPGDLILHDNKLSFFSMRFYDRALPHEFLADPAGSANDTFARGSQEAMQIFPVELDAAVRGRARVWFVIFQTALDQTAEEGRAHGNLAAMDAAMRRADVAAFGDLRIYRYETR